MRGAERARCAGRPEAAASRIRKGCRVGGGAPDFRCSGRGDHRPGDPQLPALVIRYPQGGGASAPVDEAFGDRWSFIPIGALVVDFVLTIAISVSSGVSAAIAYFPALAP
jgi:hypothetical protein